VDPMNMQEALQGYAGKRVLVTGHTGFKGAWLTFILRELGAEVMGCALPPDSGPSHFDLLGLEDRIAHVVVDIRDRSALSTAVQSFQPEYVFHLAAQALVRQSYDDPVETFATNVLGSVHLLDAVAQCESVRSLVYVTSDKCYENVEWVWGYRESDRLGGHDPYSASKAAAELVFASYAKAIFSQRDALGAATARAGNVIGGGDWAVDRIVPDCIRAAQAGRPVQLRHPAATRPWQHVLEPISGYLLLAAKLWADPAQYGGSWNFGPSGTEALTVEEVANSILGRFGSSGAVTTEVTSDQHEARLLQLNCDKAHHLLGWRPRWNAAKTLEMTGAWYEAVADGARAEAVTLSQVRDYFPELL
jgi:CDP-glucose 4,6-dehydratase